MVASKPATDAEQNALQNVILANIKSLLDPYTTGWPEYSVLKMTDDAEGGLLVTVQIHDSGRARPATDDDTPKDLALLLHDLLKYPSTSRVDFLATAVDPTYEPLTEEKPTEPNPKSGGGGINMMIIIIAIAVPIAAVFIVYALYKLYRRKSRSQPSRKLATEYPSPVKKMGSVWEPRKDEASNSTYYYNTETGQSQWERPEDFVDPSPSTIASPSIAMTQFRAVDPSPSPAPAQGAKPQGPSADTSPQPVDASAASVASTVSDWQKVWDDNQKAYYYYNTKSGTSQWEPPEGFN
jgi:hypothetical protein